MQKASVGAKAAASGESAAFVLVHGGFHGGWCYSRVAEILRAKGYRVFTPTLTGLGERSHLIHADVTCAMHVQDIRNLIQWERLQRVVLCGHSYGGVIITAVADQDPARIAALVYVDAAIPEDGKSTLDLLTEPERTALRALAQERDGVQLLQPFPASAFNVNPTDRAWVDALCTPHPFATLCEPVELTGAYLQVRSKTFVRATGWPGTHPQGSYERVKSDPSWVTVEIPCGHDVMLDAPERLADVLTESLITAK